MWPEMFIQLQVDATKFSLMYSLNPGLPSLQQINMSVTSGLMDGCPFVFQEIGINYLLQ